MTYSLVGQRDEAHKILQQLEKLRKEKFVSFEQFFLIYYGLGEQGKALEYLEKIFIYISLPLSYILFRILFYLFPIDLSNGISLIFTIIIVTFLIYILLKKKKNKFKKQINISYLSKLGKGSKDESRRIVRK